MRGDFDIIGGLRKGDDKAYSYLFKRYYEPLCKYMLKNLGSDVSCEDLTMEIFIAVWKARANFKNVTKLEAFMFVVAANKCKKVIEERRRKNAFLEQLHYISETQQLPEDRTRININPDELIAQINNNLHRLPDGCRNIFTLYYYNGYKLREIADLLEVDIRTVQKQKSVAVGKLRVLLNVMGMSASQ